MNFYYYQTMNIKNKSGGKNVNSGINSPATFITKNSDDDRQQVDRHIRRLNTKPRLSY